MTIYKVYYRGRIKTMKEIIAFSNGDSKEYTTFSNVPYFFLKTLEKKGVVVHRVNIQIEDYNTILKKIIKVINFCIRRFGRIKDNSITVQNTIERTRIYNYFVKKIMKKSVKKWPNAKLAICFDFSHSVSNFSDCKTLMFCDWTIEYEIVHHQNRIPTYGEKKAIKYQKNNMISADYIVTLFPNVYSELIREFDVNKVFYLGNVINSEDYGMKSFCENHYNSKRILFIGRKAYKEGAISLIKAIQMYNKSSLNKLELDIIGMTEMEVGYNNEFTTYYGYLNKQNLEDRELYYSLIQNAKCICNTTENWIAASSIIEAMYWQLPVIINPTEDIYKTFGKNIEFGYYCCSNKVQDIYENICKLENSSRDEYYNMTQKAYEAVKDFTWDTYIDKILELIS